MENIQRVNINYLNIEMETKSSFTCAFIAAGVSSNHTWLLLCKNIPQAFPFSFLLGNCWGEWGSDPKHKAPQRVPVPFGQQFKAHALPMIFFMFFLPFLICWKQCLYFSWKHQRIETKQYNCFFFAWYFWAYKYTNVLIKNLCFLGL